MEDFADLSLDIPQLAKNLAPMFSELEICDITIFMLTNNFELKTSTFSLNIVTVSVGFSIWLSS